MATAPRRTRTAPAEQSVAQMMDDDVSAVMAEVVPLHQRRINIEYMDIADISPYNWNPRKNAKAVASVKASIQAFGFLVPCVVDQHGTLIAGHTRVEAAKELGITDVPVIRAEFLTPEQANAFRLIDNKVAEQAEWDFDLLAGEINKLGDLNLDWTAFGWSAADLECLSELVAADCLSPVGLNTEVSPSDEAERHTQRRAPVTARIVIGEIVLFVTATQYRNWSTGIRELHHFDEDAIAEDIKRRLGILE